jgi:class 3 adenylate cyclase
VPQKTRYGRRHERRSTRGEQTPVSVPARPRIRNVSMATRLSLVVLAVTIGSLIATSIISLTYGERLADGLIRNELTSQVTLKADRFDRYMNVVQARTAALAGSSMMVEASVRFRDAYGLLTALDDSIVSEATTTVADFYRNRFAPELDVIVGSGVSWIGLMPSESPAVYLQSLYVANEVADASERRLLDDAGDGSAWSEVHRALNPRFREIVDRLGIADIYLVDPPTGTIVYSTAKAPDFATSLDSGPYDGSALANLFRAVRDMPQRGSVTISDLVPYTADVGRPAGFMASPVFEGDQMLGIFIVQIDTKGIDRIMTSEGEWMSDGLRETGETFLLGADGRMRSISRSFVEDPAEYLATVETADTTTAAERRAMAGTGTTAFFQRVIDPSSLERADSEPAVAISYLGREVFTTYRPLQISGLDWYVGAQVARAEVEQPVAAFRKALLIGVAIFVVVITFAAVAWSDRVFGPVRAIGDKLKRIHDGEEVGRLHPPRHSPSEFVMLAQSIDEMLENSRARQVELSAAADERLDIMRNLLPPSVADRVEAGDRRVLDQIPQATIVVLLVDGLGVLSHGSRVDDERELLNRLVGELNNLAKHRGVEPVKLIGDGYFAGSGLNFPVLDHAPRCVDFALMARDLARDVDPSGRLRLSAGIHSGPVTVGLAGSALLVYDLWGDTVSGAHLLARSALPDQILISAHTRGMLPSGLEVRSWGEPSADGTSVWEVVDNMTEGQRT